MDLKYWDKVILDNGNYYWGDYNSKARNMVLKLINDYESFLDVGCGQGFMYELMKDRPIAYEGIDYSEKFIEKCNERFPGTQRFSVKSAEQLSDYWNNSFDTVYCRHALEGFPDWQESLKQMFRIARKRVIIDIRRNFTNEPTTRSEVEGTYLWDFKYEDFNHLARTLSDNVSYLERMTGEFEGDFDNMIVIGKKMDNIVFTLDDFHENNHNLDILLKIKEQCPKMKVTLFTIPSLCSVEWIKGLKEKYDWMEFAMHGWLHFTDRGSQEADIWTKEEALKYISMCEEKFGDLFVKGFKAPGWQMNHETYEALKEKGYWIMDAEWLSHIRPEDFTNYYETQHLWEVNGHVQETPYNGLETIYNLKNPFLPDSNFYFVSEMVGTDKDKLRLKCL